MSERTFRFRGTLGEGAFGAVHEVEVQEADGFVRTLAVKCLHRQWSANAEYGQRLRDEARLLGLLRHPAIVTVHGLTRIDGQLAVLMELVEGTDLSRVGRLPARAALEVVAEIADALDAAWTAIPPGTDAPLRVVHRDIKPSNLMVTARGAVKVMDFGVARAQFDAREAETRSQQLGTARYMAPERWLDGIAEAPSDVFSLGVTLLELVTGVALPRPRLSRQGFLDDLDAALAHVDEPDIAALLRQMCAFDPETRPTAAWVCDHCRALARSSTSEDRVSWARRVVPELRQPTLSGERTGTVLAEESLGASTFTWKTAATESPTAPPETTTEPAAEGIPWSLGVVPILVGAAALVGWWLSAAPMAPVTAPAGSPAPDSTVAAPLPPPSADTSPLDAPADPPEPTASTRPDRPALPSEPARQQTAPSTPRPEPAAGEPDDALDAPPMVTVVFTIADGLSVSSPHGEATGPRRALQLPASQLVPLTIHEDGEQWSCNIIVGEGPSQVGIRPRAEGGCQQ